MAYEKKTATKKKTRKKPNVEPAPVSVSHERVFEGLRSEPEPIVEPLSSAMHEHSVHTESHVAPLSSATSHVEVEPRPRRRKSRRKRIMFVVVAIVCVGLMGRGMYAIVAHTFMSDTKKAERLVADVGEIFELPPGVPTIAQVSDAEKLRAEPFFAHAENGDQVLAYSDALIAILYRPATHKIIAVTPLLPDSVAPAPGGSGVRP